MGSDALCSAELNSKMRNKRFLLHPHAHTSCTRRAKYPQAAGVWFHVGRSPANHRTHIQQSVAYSKSGQLVSHLIPSPSAFLIPGHEANSSSPSCSTQAVISDKIDPGVLRTPLSLLPQHNFSVI